MMSQSALVIEVAVAELLVQPWRRRHDPSAGLGMPAHITALFPFREPSSMGRDELQSLTNLAAQTSPHRYALSAVDAFDEAVYLRPSPGDWFQQLTARLFASFPDCPPYGGGYPEIIPHLTVAKTAGGEAHVKLRHAIEAAIAPSLPIACEARALSLFINDNTQWTLAHQFPFA